MDNECVDFTFKVKDDHDYKPYLDAVKQGFLKESEIDVAVTRLFTARMKLGMFDPPEMVPYTKIDEKLLDSAAHRALARKLANEVDGAAEERRRAAAEDRGHQDRRRRTAGRPDQGAAGQLQRHSHAHRLQSRGPAKEFPAPTDQLRAGTQFLSHDADPVPASRSAPTASRV